LMNVIPAQVAGVKEIALCVPTPDGYLNPYVLMAIEMLGIKEVYRIGGAQAIAAMAFGTKTINRVDKIVGPGNIYVATAKRLVFGHVDIDMIAGPSEILIIADKGADASFIAADMISQAEHDELASSILITDSKTIVAKVMVELNNQLNKITKTDIARHSIKNYGAIITTKDIDEAIRIANLIAPEHLELFVDRPRSILSRITNAGAIFLGKWTPEAVGDYCAGPNHTLPTGGTARFASPLGTYDFLKRTSLIDFNEEGFMRLAPTVERFATLEGLDGHANSVRIRQVQSSLAPEEA
ncbi:MAG: histidinol dehydrogenase, partial [Thermodesulfovibrionales bacterium]|nr:histidinol dehydrogenase [Thermodesulfovibrionales bacterium]